VFSQSDHQCIANIHGHLLSPLFIIVAQFHNSSFGRCHCLTFVPSLCLNNISSKQKHQHVSCYLLCLYGHLVAIHGDLLPSLSTIITRSFISLSTIAGHIASL
jgi:hypothetical protein